MRQPPVAALVHGDVVNNRRCGCALSARAFGRKDERSRTRRIRNLLLAGCATPIGLPQGIPPDGYTELVSTPLGPFRYFRSLSIVPGHRSLPPLDSFQCTHTQHEIVLMMAAGSQVDAADTCKRIDAAARFSESWIEAKANRYRILFAPTDTAATIQSRTFGSFSREDVGTCGFDT